MAQWELIKEETVEAGGNNFIEINMKKPPEGDNYLIGIARGWFTDEGQKRYKTNIMFSRDKKDQVVEHLKNIDSDLGE
jgi:hypothetical protein